MQSALISARGSSIFSIHQEDGTVIRKHIPLDNGNNHESISALCCLRLYGPNGSCDSISVSAALQTITSGSVRKQYAIFFIPKLECIEDDSNEPQYSTLVRECSVSSKSIMLDGPLLGVCEGKFFTYSSSR